MSVLREVALREAWIEIHQRFKAEGLLKPQPWYYAKLSVGVSGLFVTPIIWLLLDPSWWSATLGAVLFALGSSQVALLGHDVGHFQLLRNKRVNVVAGIFLGNFLLAASRDYWIDKHERHHDEPNDIDLDPDVQLPFVIFDPSQMDQRKRWLHPLIRHQGLVFFSVLPLQAFNIIGQSMRFLWKSRGKQWRIEMGVILLHLGLYCSLLFLQLTVVQAVTFIVIHRGLFGVMNSFLFANNHKGEAMIRQSDNLTELVKQVVTARDTVIPKGFGWVFGGLQYQIAHHVSRRMPRNQLPKAQLILEEVCRRVGLEYSKVPLLPSYGIAFGHIISMPRRVREATLKVG